MAGNTGYSKTSIIAGWALALAYIAHQQMNITLARSDRFGPLREEYRGWHYLLGSLIFGLVIWRLLLWRRERAVAAPEGVSLAMHNWGRWLALIAYGLLLLAPILGVVYAWADDLVIHLGPWIDLPSLMPRDHGIWMFTGYFHSGLGFMMLVLSAASLLTGAWSLLRYGKGMLAVLPPGFGAQTFIGVASTVYAFTTFRSPEPGPRAVAIFLGICAAVWGVSWLIHRGRGAKQQRSLGPVARVAAPVLAFSLLGLGALGPWALFRVTPWPIGEKIEAPEGVTSHLKLADHPSAWEPVTAPTPFEAKVKEETYKWCRFCHTVEKNGPLLVGPNLYAIIGQKAGTTPGFTYSTALADAGRKGLVWTPERIAWFIADPQKHLPGTSMIISSGPIPDPKVQAAVVNILRRETMPQAQAEAAALKEKPQAEAAATKVQAAPSGE